MALQSLVNRIKNEAINPFEIDFEGRWFDIVYKGYLPGVNLFVRETVDRWQERTFEDLIVNEVTRVGQRTATLFATSKIAPKNFRKGTLRFLGVVEDEEEDFGPFYQYTYVVERA